MSPRDPNDVFDELLISIKKEDAINAQEKGKTPDEYKAFELYSFLEEEIKRLNKLIKLKEQSSFNLRNTRQSEVLLKKQQNLYEQHRDVFYENHYDNTPLWKSIQLSFNDFFK